MEQLKKYLSKSYLFYVVVFILIILSGILLFYDMHFGPWAFSDSAEYIISAKNLVEGNGLGIYSPAGNFMPLNLHPPLYSFLLAPFLALKLDIFIVIKWLNIFLFAGSIFLLTFGIYKITQSYLYPLAVGILFLLSPAMLNNFNGAISEPLFIFLTILNVLLLLFYSKNQNKWYFWGAVIAASLAPLTRYIGLSNIFTGFLFLLLFSRRSWKGKITISISYAILAMIPVIIWFMYIGLLSGSVGARTVRLDTPMLEAFNVNRIAFTEVLAKWLPFHTVWISWRNKVYTIYATVICTGLILISILGTWWKKRYELNLPHLRLILISCIAILGYFGFLVGSYFSSIPPDLNERMFSPTLIFIFIILFGVLFTSIRIFKLPNITNVIPIALVIILGFSYWQQSKSIISDRHSNEYSFSTPSWKNSSVINDLKTMGGRPVIYSNQPIGILIHTGFFPYEILELPQNITNEPNPQKLLVVLFYPISDEVQSIVNEFKSYQEQGFILSVTTKELSDGIIYQLNFK